MVHGTVRGLFSVLGALAMLAVVLVVWLAWSLSRGPLSLEFLDGPLEQALSRPGSGFSVRLDDTDLLWDRSNLSLGLRVENVHLTTQGREIASFPEMAMTLSGTALLRGTIQPKTVRLTGLHLHLQRDQDGNIGLGIAGTATPGVAITSDQLLDLLQPPRGDGSVLDGMRSLTQIRIDNADLQVDDRKLDTSWHASKVAMVLSRTPNGVYATADGGLDLAGTQAGLHADASFDAQARAGRMALRWSNLTPSALAALGPALQPLSAIQFPTKGSADFAVTLAGGVQDVHFDISGGSGTLDATPWLGQSYQIDSIAAAGTVAAGMDGLTLDRLQIDFGGPTLALKGSASGLGTAPSFVLQGSVDGVPLDQLPQLWPAQLLSDPRHWIVTNMTRGRLVHAEVDLTAHLPANAKSADDLAIDKLAGTVAVEGATVDFMPPMPPARDASATAAFNETGMTIAIKDGSDNGIKVTGGSVVLSGFDKPRQTAVVAVECEGSAADALRLIANKPLGFASSMGLRPAQISGNVKVNLSAKFPLLDDLKPEQVDFEVNAGLSNLAMPKALAGLDLSAGTLNAKITGAALDMNGTAQLDGIPMNISWHQNFAGGAPYRSRYQVSGTLDDAARARVGLNGTPFQAPWLAGPVPASVTATFGDDGAGTVQLDADLTQAALSLPDLKWSKSAGMAAHVSGELAVAGNALASGRNFSLTAADGSDFELGFTMGGGTVRQLNFTRAKFGRNDIQGTIALHSGDDGMDVRISGPVFDAGPLLGNEQPSASTNTALTKQAESSQPGPPVNVSARIDKVYLSQNVSLSGVSADLKRDGGLWRQAVIAASLPSGKSFNVSLTPDGTSSRRLDVTSDDGGGTLQAFGLLSNIVGGDLKIDGRYDDTAAGHPLKGELTISNYRVVRAPLLAHLFNVASLTGVVDLLTGEGIYFTGLDVPFTLDDGVLEMDNAHAGGPSVGLTAQGQVDMDRGQIAVTGTLVPFYLVNNALQNIPLIGNLVGSNGGGLIAMNYSMKGPVQDPSVTVNPLSVLTPGFLRGLFNIFGSDSDTKVRQQNAAPSPSTTAPAAPSAQPAPQPAPAAH